MNINKFLGNNQVCNEEMSQTFPQAIKNNQPFINKMVSDLAIPIANAVLNKMTLSELLSLVQSPNPFSPCN